MHLQKLSLINFKNYSSAELEFCSDINCLTGDNGVGKTNILDAIHYLALCKSYFNNIDSQNIKHGNDFFVIDGTFQIHEKEEKIYCGLKKSQKKKFSKNKKDYKKLSDHIGLIPAVVISPADIKLIIDGSEERRRFIDAVISQYDRNYLDSLIQYSKALNQRNMLLKRFYEKNYFENSELEIWNFQLTRHGNEIYKKRKDFIEEIIPVFQEYHGFIANGKEKVELGYKADIEKEDFEKILDDNTDKDRVLQYTGKGIHKDDLIMKLDGHPIKKTGSQGQQKTYLVSLKFAKYEFIGKKTAKNPLLLLDDIFDKFDQNRVEKMIELIGGEKFGQIFLTDTDHERLFTILSDIGHEYKIFNINDKNEIAVI